MLSRKHWSGSETRRLAESNVERQTTSNEWLRWLEVIKNITGAVEGADGHDARPNVEVDLHGKTFHKRADTGVSVNLIESKVAEPLGNQGVEPESAKVIMRMADESSRETGFLYPLRPGIVSWKTHS